MAAKKKAKSRTKPKKSTAKKTKKVKKKVLRKKVVARKPAKKKSAPAKKPAARKPAKPAPKPMLAPVPVGEERVGIVTHYYSHLSVAIIQIDTDVLRIGDMVHIKGHTSDFRQGVESMEINHVHVDEARPGQSFGLRVKEHAREHDVVYKVTKP